MKISKILNNNAVVVKDGKEEKIVMGPGIAFQKRKNDPVPQAKIEKVFVMRDESEKFQELLRTLPEEHIEIAEEVISYAEEKLGVELNQHIHIALTDHMSFAIERIEGGIDIQNKLLNEIRGLYQDEFQVGLWAVKRIEERFGINVPEDEAGYIALHIHTAKMNAGNMMEALNITTMISEMIEILQNECDIMLEDHTISYQRLLTHLRFALQRVERKEPFHDMDVEMLQMIKEKYSAAFRCASKMAAFMKSEYALIFPESELGYISLHIQRILTHHN
ncbi:PRD domain-containing protein [Bacillus taeanensis]|uniref:Levansucrase n=1 Tax=Bacillus taeanensis TaxID=273032 RepID=A0A366XSA3_9BACI|nr:PRD domain-containing protein [Bacillus taeanensis]RBW69012.1 levansucrase [Bacillus taeanensis]